MTITKEEFINKKLEQMCKHCKKRQRLFEDMMNSLSDNYLEELEEQYRDFLTERFEKGQSD